MDIIFVGTGKPLFDVSVSGLHFGGVFVHYGRAARAIQPVELGKQPDGVHLVHVRGEAAHESIDEWRECAGQIMRWIGGGKLDVLIDRTYPLQEAAAPVATSSLKTRSASSFPP